MKLGIVFPQIEIGADPVAIRDYAQAVEGLGYDYVMTYEHILGADPANYDDGRRFLYTHQDAFHEPFVLFGYLAGLTRRLEFITGILILPQRNTALVAKQAAEVDLLSGGRLRLGVGVGWNQAEMEALGYDFRTRGKRIDEQVKLLQRLWTEPVVTFEGEYHHIDRLGLNPLPVQRPVPLWFGGLADQVLRRMARVGSGWIPAVMPAERAKPTADRLREYLEDAGRNPADFGIDIRVDLSKQPQSEWRDYVDGWRALGATHVCANTMRMGNETVQAHIAALREFREFWA